MNKYLSYIILSLVCLSILFIYQSFKLNDGKLHLVFCNVGQGDAVFIRTANGTDILVDGGPDDSVLKCLTDHMPFWDRDIELMVLTHPHSDHLTGLISVLNRYTVISYVTENMKISSAEYKRLQDTLAKENLTANYLYSGDRIDLTDKTQIKTLWPSLDWSKNQQLQDTQNSNADDSSLDINGFSLIQEITYGNFKALLTGDAGSIVEDEVAKSIGGVFVLKVPHHGSETGISGYFLDRINPYLAVISVGVNNKYGHPSQNALNLLSQRKIKTLRTDINGEVEVITDGKNYTINKD